MQRSGRNAGVITTHLIGGLGNQMFQYAAARALALRHGAEVRLDISGFANLSIHTTRRYELHRYPIEAKIAVVAPTALGPERPKSAGIGSKWLRRLIDRGTLVGSQTPSAVHYREPHFHFDPKLADQKLPLMMEGYWQSERYFVTYANQIRKDLTPGGDLEAANAALATQIDEVEAVSIHVRRGDYVTDVHTNAFHGTCSLEYYRSAIDLVRGCVERPHLFVFSDDQAWTRANLISDLPTTYVTSNPPDRGFRDMQLMSRCRHHIIANSSFSWWGAWLNPRPDKIVVAPLRWFAEAANDTFDLLPKQWIRI